VEFFNIFFEFVTTCNTPLVFNHYRDGSETLFIEEIDFAQTWERESAAKTATAAKNFSPATPRKWRPD
ncbi:MAG: hypothetical protein ACREAM_23700, partial [Blastocatellia bacterium]